MATRIARLKRRSEFLRVAGARRKWVTPGLILQAAESAEAEAACGGYRVGLTASRKVGMAVSRNRARRRLRAVVDAVMPGRARRGHDYVVIARRETLDRPFDALVGDLETALERLAARDAGRRRPQRKATR
ncbi:MAG: ribonuclease P protein component [Alphaproteobacteria bacterium]